MKQKLLIFVLMMTLGTMVVNAQPKHRHHAVAAQAAVAADTTAKDEIEAFSDTTSVVAEEDYSAEEDMVSPPVSIDFDDFDDFNNMPDWLVNFLGGSVGVVGGIFLILMLIIGVFLALAPFIAIVLIMRYLIRRHNDRVMLAQKAMETGQPIPEELVSTDKQSDEYLRRRGIRNIWIGIGMGMMFGIWGADMLTGVGVLVLCYGIGQVMIARSSRKKNELDR